MPDTLYRAAVKKSLSDLLDDAEALIDARLSEITVKDSRAYPAQRQAYNVNIFGAMNGYLTGSDNMVAARNEFSQEMIERFYSVFTLGYTQAGGKESDLTGDSEDLQWINARTEEEIGHIKSLFFTLKEAKAGEEETRETLISLAHDRADAYTNTLDAVYNMGKLRGDKNQSLEWVLGNTEEHCNNETGTYGCRQLAGKKHTAKWYIARNLIPRMPYSGTTCGGHQCDCKLKNSQGNIITI